MARQCRMFVLQFTLVFSLLSLCVSSKLYCILVLYFRRMALSNPLNRNCKIRAVALTEPSAALSGHSRASRRSQVSIQRIAPSNPPAISAEVLQSLHKFCILCSLKSASFRYRRYSSPQSPITCIKSRPRLVTASITCLSSASNSKSNTRALSARCSATPNRVPAITPATLG